MEELLNSIGITTKGTLNGRGAYIVDIVDYEEYSKYFSLLDKSDLVDELTSNITMHTTTVTYTSGDFVIVLDGDLDADSYRIVVTELGKEE